MEGVYRIGPSVEVGPINRLIEAIESDFVIREDGEPLVDILLAYSKGYLLPLPMVEDAK